MNTTNNRETAIPLKFLYNTNSSNESRKEKKVKIYFSVNLLDANTVYNENRIIFKQRSQAKFNRRM